MPRQWRLTKAISDNSDVIRRGLDDAADTLSSLLGAIQILGDVHLLMARDERESEQAVRVVRNRLQEIPRDELTNARLKARTLPVYEKNERWPETYWSNAISGIDNALARMTDSQSKLDAVADSEITIDWPLKV